MSYDHESPATTAEFSKVPRRPRNNDHLSDHTSYTSRRERPRIPIISDYHENPATTVTADFRNEQRRNRNADHLSNYASYTSRKERLINPIISDYHENPATTVTADLKQKQKTKKTTDHLSDYTFYASRKERLRNPIISDYHENPATTVTADLRKKPKSKRTSDNLTDYTSYESRRESIRNPIISDYHENPATTVDFDEPVSSVLDMDPKERLEEEATEKIRNKTVPLPLAICFFLVILTLVAILPVVTVFVMNPTRTEDSVKENTVAWTSPGNVLSKMETHDTIGATYESTTPTVNEITDSNTDEMDDDEIIYTEYEWNNTTDLEDNTPTPTKESVAKTTTTTPLMYSCAKKACEYGRCNADTQRCECPDGTWGKNCAQKCPKDCTGGHCNVETGECECKLHYWGKLCDKYKYVGLTASKTYNQIPIVDQKVEFHNRPFQQGSKKAFVDNSTFTCTYKGVYFVSINIMSLGQVAVTVFKGQNKIIYTYPERRLSGGLLDGAAITACSTGEVIKVMVTTVGSPSGVIYGDVDIMHSSFKVVLLSYYNDSNLQGFAGYSVRKSKPQELKEGDVVSFDKIAYNDGGFFDVASNSFKCPVDGVYYTFLTAWKYGSEKLAVGIKMNNKIELHIEDLQGNANSNNTTSNSYLTWCKKGQTISVVATGKGKINGRSNYPVTSVSSVLLTTVDPYGKSTFIGFSAFKTSDQKYWDEDTIQFDGVRYNAGGHYSQTDSQFTCPVTGVYYVAVTFVKYKAETLHLKPIRIFSPSGSYQHITIVKDNRTGNKWTTVSNNFVLKFDKDEKILVKAAGPGAVHGHPKKVLTTFTVALMYRL